jgi:hypothetical protein
MRSEGDWMWLLLAIPITFLLSARKNWQREESLPLRGEVLRVDSPAHKALAASASCTPPALPFPALECYFNHNHNRKNTKKKKKALRFAFARRMRQAGKDK